MFTESATPCESATATTCASHHEPVRCSNCRVQALCLPSGVKSFQTFSLERLQVGRRKVRRGQAVYRKGERCLFLYAVRVGTFKSSFYLKHGREQVTAFHLPGELMGFDGFATGHHSTSAIALEDAEICSIPYAQLMEVARDVPGLNERLHQMMATEMVRDHDLTMLISNNSSEERVAAFLLHLSGRMRERGYSTREFQLRMTRAEIGSYLGMTLETVSRMLSLFDARGFMEVNRRRLRIADIDALRARYDLTLT